MDCTECGNDIVLVKKTKVHYNGIRVADVYLRNCEVEVCRHCGAEFPVVRNIKQVHLAIARAIALQAARLTGEEVRFLRRSLRMTVAEWAARIGIAPETFSRWENGRSPAQQVEKLARIDFLARASSGQMSGFELSDMIAETLTTQLSEQRESAIVIDVEDLDSKPRYESLTSPEMITPSFAHVEALTLGVVRLANVKLARSQSVSQLATGLNYGEICDASHPVPVAA